jgi:hypothetical protein
MATATYDDVNLIMKLYDLRRESTMRRARTWFSSKFKARTAAEYQALCPPGSEMAAFANQVTTYWDMAASFVESGVLNRELFYQNNRELLFVWLRIEPVVTEYRAATNDLLYLKNLESVGRAYADYVNQANPEAYQVYVQTVRG